MFDVKYRLVEIEEFNGEHNPLHDDLLGKACYPAYFKPGEHGWMFCEIVEFSDPFPHRIRTSVVRDVTVDRGGGFTVTTENSRMVFREIHEEEARA